MTSRISKLVLAAAIAATLPAAAVACDHDGGRREEAAWPAPWRPAPEPSRGWRETGRREREAYLRASEIYPTYPTVVVGLRETQSGAAPRR